jgi:hypothetical protein
MKEQLTVCAKCGSDACHVASNDKFAVWSCFGCGFTTNSTLTEDKLEEVEAVMPQLYKDLRFKDENNLYWYPSTVILEDKSMVFIEGTAADNWKWIGVQSKDNKADMNTKQEYEQHDFMEALDYIGFFEKQK